MILKTLLMWVGTFTDYNQILTLKIIDGIVVSNNKVSVKNIQVKHEEMIKW